MKKIFIAYPLGADDSSERARSERVINHIISPVLQAFQSRGEAITLVRPDKMATPGRISRQVLEEIVNCDVMIADVTGANANVLYEIGLRQGLLKPYILIAEKGQKLPFDLADIRTIYYHLELDSVSAAQNELENVLDRALKGEISPIDQELILPPGTEGGAGKGPRLDVRMLEASSQILREVAGVREKLNDLDRLSKRVEDIKSELDRVDYIARYGRAPAHLVNLLRLKRNFHGRAGGEAIGDVLLRVYSRAAEELDNLARGSQESVRFEEYHLVDKFLLNLMRVLPNGSVWLGVTRLQAVEAWTEGIAEESYFRFQELVQKRTELAEIQYYRLWCFDNESVKEKMVPLLRRQAAAKIATRCCTAKNLPDMSLIWVPKISASSVAITDTLGQLSAKLRGSDYDPLCGLVFDPRGGKELDGMTLYSPSADQFEKLRFLFEQNWDRAENTAAVGPR